MLGCLGAAPKKDDDFARYFLKTPAAENDQKLVERFLALDPAEFPKKLRVEIDKKQKAMFAPSGPTETAPIVDDGKAPYAEDQVKLARYVLDTPTADAEPALVKRFLDLDPSRLPKKMRGDAATKQLEIKTLVKLHDTKKKGGILNPVPGCNSSSGIRKTADIPAYQFIGYGEIFEEERAEVEKRTLCNEDDMVCQFSLVIFHDGNPKIPRRLFMHGQDPLMGIIAASRGKAGGQTNFFGSGAITCAH
jgi:hypothetical protein